MKRTLFPMRSKAWGVIPHRDAYDHHFHSGYQHKWAMDPHRHPPGDERSDPSNFMLLGQNAILEGVFCISNFARGRSAANYFGFFYDYPEIEYEMGMAGVMSVLKLIQGGEMMIDKKLQGIDGRWSFAKQGQSILLQPHPDSYRNP